MPTLETGAPHGAHALENRYKLVNNLEVLFSDLSEIRALRPKVCGVLGQNSLSLCNYLVDYAKRQISLLDEPHERWCGERLPFTTHEGKILLPINQLGSKEGLLPMSLFQTIFVNNRQSYVILNPT